MEHGEGVARAHPSSCSEWHHLNLFTSGQVKLQRPSLCCQEPLWLESHGVLPNLRIPTHLCNHKVDSSFLGDQEPIQNRVMCHSVGQHKMSRRVSPQTFQVHRPQVRHPLQILLPNVGAGAGAHHTLNI
ncbi:hypothetical protein LINGRAPRIM_LOCUS1616 [Linum grandiflorum]